MPAKYKEGNPFHIILSNHRYDVKHPNAFKAYKHFVNRNHVFHKDGKFILIEQSSDIKNALADVLKKKLKDRKLLDKKTKNVNTFESESRTIFLSH